MRSVEERLYGEITMDWPSSADYSEAVQNLKHSMGDKELRIGEAATDALGLPMLWAGGFANVYKIHNSKTGNTWALKCFTRKISGQADRYRQISEHLQKARLPFMVDFTYLNDGIRIRGEWFPALKMRWVEGGIRLNEFVEEYLNRPRTLRDLLEMWPKMASRLRGAKIAHADLQHGNVLLVPRSDRRLALRLIDYDGMHVPSLAGTPSAELGHPAFQHPERGRRGTYSAEVDRFSNLAIYSAIHSLTVGGRKLWERFNNDDNLLFRQEDFRDPGNSDVFHAIWGLPDPDTRALIGRLALACKSPLDRTPLLDDVTNSHVPPLTEPEMDAVESILGANTKVVSAAASETTAPLVTPEGPDSLPVPRRSLWLVPLYALDGLLRMIAGQENEILHNFLRLMTSIGVAALFFFIGKNLPLGIEILVRSKQFAAFVSALPMIGAIALMAGAAFLLYFFGAKYLFFGSKYLQEWIRNATRRVLAEKEIAKKLGMPFAEILAGEFMMGSPEDDFAKQLDEIPQHLVRIAEPFYLGIYQVTQKQYEAVMGRNPSHFRGPNQPVERVSWEEATAFCVKLSELSTRYDYRLPSEAEWEYSCRAGTTARFCCGDRLTQETAWFETNSRAGPNAVGKKQPNAWGVYDMHGNVWEWCCDWYTADHYESSTTDSPVGPAEGSMRVARGGSWMCPVGDCRSASRCGYPPTTTHVDLGFRVVRVPRTAKQPGIPGTDTGLEAEGSLAAATGDVSSDGETEHLALDADAPGVSATPASESIAEPLLLPESSQITDLDAVPTVLFDGRDIEDPGKVKSRKSEMLHTGNPFGMAADSLMQRQRTAVLFRSAFWLLRMALRLVAGVVRIVVLLAIAMAILLTVLSLVLWLS